MAIKGFELQNIVDAKVKVCAVITNQSQQSIMNKAIEDYCDKILKDNKKLVDRMFNIK